MNGARVTRPREVLRLLQGAAPATTSKRLKVLVLTPDTMTKMLHGARPRVPGDAVVVCDQSRTGGKDACWLISSASFPCLAPDEPAPAVYPALDIAK